MSASGSVVFDVVGIAAHGAVQTERVTAQDPGQATQLLQLKGWRVLSCRPAATGFSLATLGVGTGGGRARLDIGLFSEEIAALLDAGLGMIDAIRTLASKERDNSARIALERVAADLSEGLPLSRALQNQPGTFPALLTAAVLASEQTGDLVTALRRYGVHLETLNSLRGKVMGAAIYPAVLLAVGALVVLFLLGVVVPRFALLLEGGHRDLPLASSVLLSWGKTVSQHPWFFAAAFAGIVASIVVVLVRAMRNGWQIRGLQKLWIIGPLVRMFRHAQFFRTSAMLVHGGIPVVRAFSMCRALLTPEDQIALDAATTEIAEGQRIGPALQRARIADAVALRMLEVAQRTGKLADVLARIAQFQESHLARAVGLASRLIEPALMIFIGLVIGAIVVLMYMPIFDLASSLQ